MAFHYISAITIIGICTAVLRRIARRSEEPTEAVSWDKLPDDVYLSDALYSRLGG